MKKSVSLLLALVLMLSVFPITAAAASSDAVTPQIALDCFSDFLRQTPKAEDSRFRQYRGYFYADLNADGIPELITAYTDGWDSCVSVVYCQLDYDMSAGVANSTPHYRAAYVYNEGPSGSGGRELCTAIGGSGATLVSLVRLSDGRLAFATDSSGSGYTLPTEYLVYDGAGLFSAYTGSTAGITKVWDIRYDLPGAYELYTVPDPDAPFTDVKKTDYFYEPVKWAVSSGVTKGATATTFSPNTTCTRQQVVTFLYRACGSPAVSGSNPFKDVKSTDYSYNAILWAVANGITKGTTDTTFSPTDTCTSAHVLTFLYRAKGSPAVSGAVGSHYYDAAAQWANEIGLYNGLPYGFSAGRKAPRAEIVTYLYSTRSIAAAESRPAPSAAALPDGRYDVSFRRDGLTSGKSGESILFDVVEYLGLSVKEAAALSRGQVLSFSKLVPGTPDITVSTWKTQGNMLTINGEHEFWLNKDLDNGAGRYVYIDPDDPNGPGLTYVTNEAVRLSVASGAKVEDWTSASLRSHSSVSEFFTAFPVDSWIGHIEVSGGSITLASFDYRP